ncbi:MAG: cytochrome c oxidase subunit II transmembrane domain-containing protein, partial [Parvularcula sp.]|nr:cytochrome c oxidase subunit II transmembrane domain-containing protein [Parvularcula sp.]
MTRLVPAALAALFLLSLAGVEPAFAQEAADIVQPDRPDPIGTGLRDAATPVAYELHGFYDFVLLPMKLVISFLVLALIIYVVFRFNKRANPVPRRFSHNTLVEVAWTLGPVLILLIIAIPSFDLLYLEDTMPDGQVFEYEPTGGTQFGFNNDFPASRMVESTRHIEVAAVATDGSRR